MSSFLGVPVDAAYHLVSGLTGFLTPVLGGLAAVAAIVAFTMAVRLLLMPLSLRALRGQAAQARLAPHLVALRQRYGKQPERLQREMAALYKREGTSMFAGFAPLLLQWPFLSVMYLLFRSPGVGRPEVGRQVGDLAVPDVVSGQLGRSELGPAPLARRLALLLVATVGHQRHGLGLGHAVRVDPGVQDRVDGHSQLHLELLHPHRARIALARVFLLRHDPFGVDRPSLRERPRPQRGPDRGVRAGEP